MKRILSLPAIGLLIGLLLISKLSSAQTYFTVDIKGKGEPMILIHGLYCNGDVWKETVERYQSKYECHILTLAGFGGNPSLVKDNFLESVKNDLIEYVKTKKLKKPILIGHSMGAFISFWAGASAPGIFEKIIAVDGLPYLTAVQMPAATPESAKTMGANMKNTISNQKPEEILAAQKMYLPSMITSNERINQVAEIASKADPKTQGQVIYEMYTTDLRQTVASIDCPVLLLGTWIAYKDYGVTKENVLNSYKAQVSLVKNNSVDISDSGKHFIFYDDTTWFYNKVDTFLKN